MENQNKNTSNNVTKEINQLNALYEDENFFGFVEDTLRPGGLQLTAEMIGKCNLSKGAKILDIGCGYGKTVKFLRDQMGLQSFGIDTAANMVKGGLAVDGSLNLLVSDAETLPFADAAFDAVITECVFCLLPNKPKALAEIRRVLKPNGKLIISDLYLQKPSSEKVNLNGITCLQNLMTKEEICQIIIESGFLNRSWDDKRSDYLGFLAEMIFEFDTVEGFWQWIFGGECGDLCSSADKLKKQKISYYSALWQREGL